MNRPLENFLAAIRFFTRLPVPAWVGHSQEGLGRAVRYFPLVGLLVGVLGAVVTELAAMALPITPAILLGMLATLLITGAFHEDGLADSCDGLGGGWGREQVLTIMKDSRIGSYGAIGIGMVLALKFSLLQEIDAAAEPPALALALVAGHAASRFAPVLVMRWLDYARENDAVAGKSKPLARNVGVVDLVWAGLFALLPGVLLAPAALLSGGAGVLLVAFLATRYFRHRLGGYTGDTLGATQQLAELAFYTGLLCVST